MADELEELVQFLADDRAEVKSMAADIVQGLTGSQEGIDKLVAKADSLLPMLLRLANDDQPSVSLAACTSLVNLSQEQSVVLKLLRLGVIDRVMDYMREGTCKHTRELLMLITNVSQIEEGARATMQKGKGKLEGFHLGRLLGMFLSPVDESKADDTTEYLANVLTNITRTVDGRKFVLEPGRGLVMALAKQLLPGCGKIRRLGCANTLRNCFYTCRADGTLPAILEAKSAIPLILRPISGEEPKETEDGVREALAEAVLMLAAEEEGREALLEYDAHMVLKKGYELEEHPPVCEAMERTAVIFMTKGQVEPEEGESEKVSGDNEIECQVVPGGFSLG